ncbi:MAG: DUF6671 family protein [Pseudohongiellaceae bacterium]
MTQSNPQFPVYRDRPVALLTRHHKANVIAPPLAVLGLEVHSTDAFDTDTLGTFSGEIERKLSPLDCARRKARLACELTGLSIGLGSEGSFGGGPLAGLMNWDEELLVLVDIEHDLEITAVSSGPVQLSEFAPHSVADVQRQLAPFPADQGWILKLPNQISKGLVGPEQVAAQLDDWQLTNEAACRIAEGYVEQTAFMHCGTSGLHWQGSAGWPNACSHCAGVVRLISGGVSGAGTALLLV